ncbi:MAG: mannose-6-phosphate isomerase [Bacteroidetes bacterium 4572_128]|nr:MAG: mannose-6-phosphate isomerase [Bacteroidetes bacterium 4572_128]
MLYPLKFKKILKNKIWGDESWEISGLQENVSVVKNGFLKGNSINELIEIYMDELVGDSVYKKFGLEFPLLIKFINAEEKLSIQVHPNDKIAKERHQSFGKNELWYIMRAKKNAKLISGFSKEIDKKIFLENIENKTLDNILNYESVKEDDVFFIPSGRVHNIGEGILLAEIQQSSDITYRIYDFDRKDSNEKPRELHTELAKDAIDYKKYESYKTDYKIIKNKTSKIINTNYFKTNILYFDKKIEKNYNSIDSFIIFICLKNNFKIIYDNDKKVFIEEGETVLIPASLKNIDLIPLKKMECKIIEVFN